MTEVFILVPALLGLKGNLEMTLASRLSTAVSIRGAGGSARAGSGGRGEGLCARGGWADKNTGDHRKQSPECGLLGSCLHPTGLIRFEGLIDLKLCSQFTSLSWLLVSLEARCVSWRGQFNIWSAGIRFSS